MSRKNPQTNRETCYFCGDNHAELLETHHILPRRHGGSDNPENLVDVCPTCHQKLENIYDERFFTALGATDTDETVEFIAGRIAYELLTLQKDVLNRISQTAEWTEETWIHQDTEGADFDEYAWRLRDSYTDFDYEHAATAIFNDILPEEKELKIVDESTPDDVELTEFDADVVERGSEGITNIKDLIASIEGDWDEGAPITEVLDQAENLGMERSQAKYEIEKLRRQGDAYEPTTDHLRTV